MNKKILFWVNCYGAWDPESRWSIETIGYDQYLSAVVRSIEVLKDRIEAFYISGGMYDSKSRVECETVKPELEKRLSEKNIKLDINTDEESITSVMIMKKFLETWKEKYTKCEPIIIVDKVRYEVNKFTFEYFCKELKITSISVVDTIIPFERLDNHPNGTTEKQAEKLKLMKEKGVEYVESIIKEARKEHLKKKSS